MTNEMKYKTLDSTDKALLQEFPNNHMNSYVVVTWSYYGQQRREKWFEDLKKAERAFNVVK